MRFDLRPCIECGEMTSAQHDTCEFCGKYCRALPFHWRNLVSGSTVEFGCLDGRPLRWLIAKVEPDRLLLLCANLIGQAAFSREGEAADWEHSPIRHALNVDFLPQAFNGTELPYICEMPGTCAQTCDVEPGTAAGPEAVNADEPVNPGAVKEPGDESAGSSENETAGLAATADSPASESAIGQAPQNPEIEPEADPKPEAPADAVPPGAIEAPEASPGIEEVASDAVPPEAAEAPEADPKPEAQADAAAADAASTIANQLFVPSIEEARLLNILGRNLGSPWWLRTPGLAEGSTTFVKADGTIHETGIPAASQQMGIRPALWVRFDAL